MSEYTRYEIKGKGFRYRKDGKLISKDDVPEEEIRRLEAEDVAVVPPDNDEALPEEHVPVTNRVCVFCGMHSNWTRFVNGQTVVLCETHYYNETIGKIAQKLREDEHATIQA